MKELSIIALSVTLLVGSCVVGGNEYSRYQCESYARITGKATEYNNYDICYVNGQRWDEYLAAQTAANFNEGVK